MVLSPWRIPITGYVFFQLFMDSINMLLHHPFGSKIDYSNPFRKKWFKLVLLIVTTD